MSKIKRGVLAFLMCLTLLASASTSASTTFDLSAQFGTNSNPNGPWSYGWEPTVGGKFTLLTNFATNAGVSGVPYYIWSLGSASDSYAPPTVTHNSSTNTLIIERPGFPGEPGTELETLPPGATGFAGGYYGTLGDYGVVRFTVPSGEAGVYALSTAVQAYLEDGGDPIDFHLLWNGAQVLGQYVPVNNVGTSFAGTIALSAGDTVDFVCGSEWGFNVFGAGLNINATLTPTNGAPTISTNAPPKLSATNGVYNLAADFSATSNPNGVWSYGGYFAPRLSRAGFYPATTNGILLADNGVPLASWYPPANLAQLPPLEVYPTNAVQVQGNLSGLTGSELGGQAQFPPGSVRMFGGLEDAPSISMVRFTVPAWGAGIYSVVAGVQPAIIGTQGANFNFSVNINGIGAFAASLRPWEGTSFSRVLALAAGDTIDFAVEAGVLSGEGGVNAEALIDATITQLQSATNLPPPPQTNGMYDVSADFSGLFNPNGAWSYGWEPTVGGTFTLLTNFETKLGDGGAPFETWDLAAGVSPSVSRNATTNTVTIPAGGESEVFPPGATWFNAGTNGAPQNYGVIRFSVPTGGGGVYALSTVLRPYLVGASSGEIDFHLLWNGAQVIGLFVPVSAGTNIAGTILLSAGDTIDFLCGREWGTNAHGAGLAIEAELVLTNGPVTLSVSTPPPPPATNGLYDLAADFSASSNPNGVWSYGWETGSNFTPSASNGTVSADNGVSFNVWYIGDGAPGVEGNLSGSTGSLDGGQGQIPTGSVWLYSGSAARFTVPAWGAGSYHVTSAAQPTILGTSATAYVFGVNTNGTEFFSQSLAAYQGTNFSLVMALAAGDTIDFRVENSPSATSGPAAEVLISATIQQLHSATNIWVPQARTNGVYDVSADFSAQFNPNGAWSFGWEGTNRQAFTLYASNATALDSNGLALNVWSSHAGSSLAEFNPTTQIGVANGGAAKLPPGSLRLQAGAPGEPDYFATARFTVPPGAGGYYTVTAGVSPSITGTNAGSYQFQVAQNLAVLFNQSLSAIQNAAYSNALTLAAGDTLDFLVGRGTNATAAGAEPFLNATITFISIASPTPPSITAQPQSQSVNFGQTTTLSVTVSGSSPFTYQWYAGGSGDLRNPIAGATNATFSSGGVFATESFWVAVQNPEGSTNSAAAVLTPVNPTPPAITVQPQSQSVILGQVVTLSVTVSGTAPFTYQWYAGASGNMNNLIPGATNASFSPGSVFASESFWVAVQNSQGGANSSTAALTIVSESQPTLGIQIAAGLPFITITGLQGITYRLQSSTNLATTNWTTLTTVTLPGSTFTISDSGATNSARFYRAVTP